MLAFSQLLGSVVVTIARAVPPNRLGPVTIFPDAAKWEARAQTSSCLVPTRQNIIAKHRKLEEGDS